MKLDVVDVIADAAGSLVGRVLLFGFAVWLGSALAELCLVLGMMMDRPIGDCWFWCSPLLTFNMWWMLNVPFVLFSLIYFIRSESAGWRAWMVVVGVEALDVMAGWAHVRIWARLPQVCSWFALAFLLVALGCGVWWVQRLFFHRRLREIDAIRAQNAQNARRREEFEASERQQPVENPQD